MGLSNLRHAAMQSLTPPGRLLQESESSHPSQFLTTRDVKPRLFPFPLGKAGGQSLKGELWWEAGNSAHVYVVSIRSCFD